MSSSDDERRRKLYDGLHVEWVLTGETFALRGGSSGTVLVIRGLSDNSTGLTSCDEIEDGIINDKYRIKRDRR